MRETWRKERKGRSETGTVLYVSHRTGAEDRGEALGGGGGGVGYCLLRAINIYTQVKVTG